jgi:ubiquinone/menaquinone biosynthesis C-methylase UbiE
MIEDNCLNSSRYWFQEKSLWFTNYLIFIFFITVIELQQMIESQRKIWRDEHIKQKTFTRIHSEKPSGPIPDFIKFIKEQGFIPNKTSIIDIGCGKGRNSICLASQGFNVTGVDFAPEAIKEARKRAEEIRNIRFENLDISKNWPYKNDSFEIIIDCFSTMCIPLKGRQNAISESFRVLKTKGYFLFYAIGRTSLVDKSPGPEINSAIFPRTGKFEKQYEESEIRNEYRNFKIISLEKNVGNDVIEGKEFIYPLWVGIFQK